MKVINVDGIPVEVSWKDIKRTYLKISGGDGSVTVSTPLCTTPDEIERYLVKKLPWIKQKLPEIKSKSEQFKQNWRKKELSGDGMDTMSFFYRGVEYLLQIVEIDDDPDVEFINDKLVLKVPTWAFREKDGLGKVVPEIVIERMKYWWYKAQLGEIIYTMLGKWQKVIGVTVDSITLRKMKTKWGSCTPARGNIRFNIELAKTPIECIEFIVVHELVHFHELKHNARFFSLMDKYMPNWKMHLEELKKYPVAL